MEAGACGFSVQKAGKFSAQRDFDGEPMCTDTMANEDLYAFGSQTRAPYLTKIPLTER